MPYACLMYHSLRDGRDPDPLYPRYTTTRALFAAHLRALGEAGFRLAPFSDLLRRLGPGEEIPDGYCALTIDDGHRSGIEMAELMAAAGVRGTFFLTRDYCRGRADFMKPAEVRELAAAGFDFGTHGTSHRALSRMPREQMRAELADSKAWLEDILGRGVEAMSLPAGEGDGEVYDAAHALGYRLVGNSRERLNAPGAPPRAVNRFVVLAGHGPAQVCRIARGSRRYMWRRRARAALLYVPKLVLRSFDETRGAE
jgi:peptidoglycan/xylan/chitin deacetylase (PgdA/CDA1 family)